MAFTEMCDEIQSTIRASTIELTRVTCDDIGVIVVLPLVDNLGEEVEVYISPLKASHDKVLVSDGLSLFQRYSDWGYEWGATPNQEKFESLLQFYDLRSDEKRGVYEEAELSAIGGIVIKIGQFISEASQYTLLSRYRYQFNFKRAFRSFLLSSKIDHDYRPAFPTDERSVNFDFALGSRSALVLNALSANSSSTADSQISKTYMDVALMKRQRGASSTPLRRTFTFVFDDESQIPSSARFKQAAEEMDVEPVASSKVDDLIPQYIAEAEAGSSTG